MMKKLLPVLLICLMVLSACAAEAPKEATEPVGQMQIGNPWKSYESLTDAETASGLTFPVPETIPAGYVAESYRVMSGSLLEATYRNGETEITVRMKSGSNEDISGVYENFTKTETFHQNDASVICKQADDCLVYLVQKDSYCFSIYANSPTAEDACREILTDIC